MGTLTDIIREAGRKSAIPSSDGAGVGQIDEREQAIIDRYKKNARRESLFQEIAEAEAEEAIAARRQQRAYAEKAPVKISEPVREMLSNLDNRTKVRSIYQKLTPEQRQEALNVIPGISQQLGGDRGGAAGRMGGALRRGVSVISQPAAELADKVLGTDFGGTPEEIAFIRQMEAAKAQEFAPALPSDPWYERFPLQALEMAPFSAATLGGGAVGGAVGKVGGNALARGAAAGVPGARGVMQAAGAVARIPTAVGLPAVTAQGVGTVAGITAVGFPSQYAQELDQLKELGVEDGVGMQSLAVGTALVSSALEAIMPNPFKGVLPAGAVSIRDGATKAARQYLWEAIKRAPPEMSEEYVQGLASGLGKTVASYLDMTTKDVTLGDAFATSFEQGNAAIGPMAFLLGVPAAGGAAYAGLSARRETPLGPTVGPPPGGGKELPPEILESLPQAVISPEGEVPAGATQVVPPVVSEQAQRLARLQEIRAKGPVSRKDARELGIEGNQDERTAQVDAAIEQLSGMLPPTLSQGAPDETQVQPNEESTVQGQARVQGEQEARIQGVEQQAAQGDAGTEVQVGKQPWEMSREEFEKEAVYQGVNAATDESKPSYWFTNQPDEARMFAEGDRGDGTAEKRTSPRIDIAYRSDLDAEEQDSGRPSGSKHIYTGGAKQHRPVRASIPLDASKDPHRALVESALASGKPVPPEVLAEYPDLQSTSSTAATAAGEMSTKVDMAESTTAPVVDERDQAEDELAGLFGEEETKPTEQPEGGVISPIGEKLPATKQPELTPPAEKPQSPEDHAKIPMFGVYKTTFKGKKKYAVKEFENKGFGDSLFDTEAEANKQSELAKRQSDEKNARQEKAKADEETEVKKQQEYEGSFQGFLSDTPMVRGRQLSTLGKQRSYQGKVVTVKELIEQKVADGAIVNEDGQLESPDGAYLDSNKITKIGIDYARHLIARNKTSENPKNDTARPDKSSELDSKPGSQPEGVGSSAPETGAAQPASEQARANLRKRGKKKPSQADIDAETAAVLREREADNKVRQEFQADRDAQKAQDARREFVGKQKTLANPATVDSLGYGDIAQVNDDIERGRVSYEDATKVADEFVAAGYLPKGKRDQIRKPTPASADQVNVDSGAESKVKPESTEPEFSPIGEKPEVGKQSLPWIDSSTDDESRWYGTKVSVAPASRREEPYSGQVVRVLNRGEMVEVQPDGQDGTFRVDSSRITLTEVAPTVADKTSVEPSPEPLPEPTVPKFTRTTPDKGSTTRQFQSERVEKARGEIADLERKRRAKRSEHDGLRSNATKKRAAVRGEIESFNRMIGKIEGEIASDMASDTLAKLEDELESPRSYDHYLAGVKAIHKLKASVAEDAARRGEMGREVARTEVSKEQKEADRLDAELQSRAKEIAMSKGFTSGDSDQIALSASNGFTVFEDRSLADIVEVQGTRTRESRVSQEINKLKPSSPYGQQDLSTEQIADFTKQYQEASLDDNNWLDKRKEVDKSVREAIQANRDAVRKREDEERKAKEAEKAKDDQERLANARERAKKYFLDERISKALKKQKPKTKPVKLRQEKAGGPVKIVDGKITDGDQSGELYPNGLILHKSFEEGSKDFVFTHARSGSGFPFSAKKSAMQELIGITDLLGIDFNVDTDEKGALPSELTARVKNVNNAWDNNDYSLLSDEDYATVQTLAETAKTDIDADLILTADDLGANGIPPGLDNVMTDKGLRIVKEMAIAVPEFSYDPVFTVKDGKLLYRDGFEFKLEPTAFNLHPSELNEGQTVGINLEDLGIKRSTPQDVVAEMMKQAGIPRVTKNKGGDVSVGYAGAKPTSLEQGNDDNEWSVVGGAPKVQEMATSVLKKIRWRQPGQDGDPKTDIDVVPVAKDEPAPDIVTPLDPVKRIENVIEQGRSTGREPSKAMLEKLAEAKSDASEPVIEAPPSAPVQADFMELSNGVNAPGVKQTIRVTAGERTLLMEKGKADNEWSIREGEKYTGEVKGKTAVKKGGELIVSGIVETKKAKEIAQRIIDGTFDKDADKRFVREDTQNIGMTNAGIAESMKDTLGGRRDSFAKLLRENGLVTDGRFLMKVSDKDRDAILKSVGETFEGRDLSVVSKMLDDGQKALSRVANVMKPIGYRGGYLTSRTVVLQSQDGDAAIFDKSLHDTILKKYPNAVPYFLEDGKPISYAIDGELVAIVMPMNMDKPDAKVNELVAGKYDFEAAAAEAAKFPPPQPKTKLKKAAEKANKELANAVDEFGNVIKGKLGMNLPLNPEVIAAAAKVVAKAIQAGTLNFAELMERMVTKYGDKMAKRMEGALQQEWDKQVNSNPIAEDGITPKTPQPHPELVQPEPIPLTSVKNAIVDELRVQRGEAPMPEVTPETVQQWLELAGNRIANDPYAGNTLVEQLLSGDKTSVDEMEGMVLQYHYRAVNNLFEAADAKLTEAKANGDPAEIAIAQDEARVVMRRLAAIETALDKAGTAWGRAGVSRQIFLKQDFSLGAMVRRARVANGGDELSDAQVAILSEQAEKIKELQKQLAELEAKVEAKTAEQEQAKVIDEAIKKDVEDTKKPPVAKPKSKMRLKAEARLTSAWEKFGAAAKGKLYSNPIDPELIKPALEVVKAYVDLGIVTFREFMSTAVQNMGAKEAKASEPTFRAAWDQLKSDGELAQPALDITNVGQLTRFARQVQRTMVESGVTEREAVVDGVHEALQEIIPEITRRQAMDALSSYGQFAQLSKDPIDQIIRDINGQLQQLAKLEDMEKGQAPAKTGVERRSPTDEERRLTQLVNEAKRRGGFVVTDPETQLKSAMGAAKTAVRNRIADMNYEIKTGSRVVRNKTELIPDAELEQLRKDRDELQKVHKEMFPPKGATEAQKIASANRALDTAISSLEAKLAVGDISPAPQPSPLSTPEIDAKRARLKELHEQRDALRKTDEQTKVRAIDRSIEALERELAAGDFTLKPKPAPLTSPEIDARLAKLEELRATKKSLVAAANPNMTEQRASRAYEAHLRKQLAMYLEKIAQGDFEPKQKKQPRVLTKGELDLKKQLADVKHDFFEALAKYHLENMSPGERAIDIVRESAHLSRAIMTSIDLSAILRQGGLGVYSHPAMARKAAAEMWGAIWSREKEFQSVEKLRTRPNSQLYEESGLNITDSEGKLTRQEEAFMGRWARTGIDFLGKRFQAGSKVALEPVAASSRAYVTFINNLRADLFDVMVENLGQGGQVTKEEAKLIAKYVNVATGRSDLKALNNAAATLNTVFFAPRYVASRFQYLAMPFYLMGTKDSARVKKLIVKEYARTFTGAAVFIGSLTALAYLVAGDDEEEKPSVEFSPLSADFGKVRIDETRLDPLAGLAQVIVFSSRMAAWRTKSSVNGKIKPFYEGGPYETTHASEAGRFIRTKLAPVPGAAVTAFYGMKDVVGETVTPAGLVGGLFVPISVGEVYSTMRHRGIPKGTALAVLNSMGASVNTYGPKTAYLDATPEERSKQLKDYIKSMNWESDLPAFSPYLKPEELKQVQDRQNERRGDLVYEAMGKVLPKNEYKTEAHFEEAQERFDKVNKEFEEFRKQYAPTFADAARYLNHHFDDEGGVKIKGTGKKKPSFRERNAALLRRYQ